jgi:hypothetical protein
VNVDGCVGVESWVAAFVLVAAVWALFAGRRKVERDILEADKRIANAAKTRASTEKQEAAIRKGARDAQQGSVVEVLDRAARDLGFVVGSGGAGKPDK